MYNGDCIQCIKERVSYVFFIRVAQCKTEVICKSKRAPVTAKCRYHHTFELCTKIIGSSPAEEYKTLKSHLLAGVHCIEQPPSL